MNCRRLLAAVLFAACATAPLPAAAQPASSSPGREAARPIAAAAMKAYDERRYAESIDGFRQADGLYPTPQYRVYIARAYKWLGKVASAAGAYQSAVSMVAVADSPRDFASVQATAASELSELRPRIPILTIQLQGAPGQEVRVTLDGALVPAHLLERLELDPGDHTLEASAPGFVTAVARVQVAESTFTPVSLSLLPVSQSSEPPPASVPLQEVFPNPATPSRAPVQAAPEGPREADVSTYSHRWRPGVLLRGDIDPIKGGVLFAPGLTLGLLDHLEIGATALIGPNAGVEPLARWYILAGPWKPLVEAAAPIFFVSGAHAGVRGAAGVQWDFHPHFGAFVTIGGAYFPEPPPRYASGYFLPSFGVQGRL